MNERPISKNYYYKRSTNKKSEIISKSNNNRQGKNNQENSKVSTGDKVTLDNKTNNIHKYNENANNKNQSLYIRGVINKASLSSDIQNKNKPNQMINSTKDFNYKNKKDILKKIIEKFQKILTFVNISIETNPNINSYLNNFDDNLLNEDSKNINKQFEKILELYHNLNVVRTKPYVKRMIKNENNHKNFENKEQNNQSLISNNGLNASNNEVNYFNRANRTNNIFKETQKKKHFLIVIILIEINLLNYMVAT